MKRVLLALTSLALSIAPAFAEGADKSNTFPFKLFQDLAKQRQSENFLISPFSVSTALGMTYLGAGGETKTTMGDVLNLQGKNDDAVSAEARATLDKLRKPGGGTKLEIANGLFGNRQFTFKPDFLNKNKSVYDAAIESLDFNSPDALKKINGFVSDKTHGKIPTIVDKIGNDAILYLINAIYFKGSWANKFDSAETKPGNFNKSDKLTKQVQMMHMSRSDFRYLENSDFQAINLPYADKRLSLYVFLPAKGKSLSSFEQNFTATKWQGWVNQFHKREGNFSMPRFKVEDKMSLKAPLEAIGMSIAFDPNKADFSAMAKTDKRIYISQVMHKTFMEVNEEGTEAAAATSVEMSVTMAPMNPVPPFEMHVVRPFVIALHDRETGKLLFVGHIANP
jgi:serine protease inhibitor